MTAQFEGLILVMEYVQNKIFSGEELSNEDMEYYDRFAGGLFELAECSKVIASRLLNKLAEIRAMSFLTKFIGKWKLTASDNFDEYLKEVGVGFLTRKVAATLKPQLEFSQVGDEYTMTSTSTFTTHISKFRVGQIADGKTADGREVTWSWIVNGEKLIQDEQGKNGGKDSHFERYIDGGKLVITCTSGKVTSTRKYEKA